MLGSRNDFFLQEEYVLRERRIQLEYLLLDIWRLSKNKASAFLEAYDYFVLNPRDYDGATIVNDICYIPGLDIWAMIHDYIFVKFKVAASIGYKIYSDIVYAQLMRKFKISWGSAWIVRFGGLAISTIPFVIFKRVFRKLKMKQEDKIDFINYINKLE